MLDQIPEGERALLLAFLSIAAAAAVLAWRAFRTPVSSPQRLVAELRLVQFGGGILVFSAGAAIGLTALAADRPGVALEVMIALGFVVVAGTIVLRDPREALPLLAMAFAAHALIDILHRPGMLSPDLAPRWFVVGCAVHDVVMGALCYLPVIRRG
jgi:hypothetical protein